MKKLLAVLIVSAISNAQAFELFKDYKFSTDVWNITFIKVNPNRINDYLAGLQQTWQSSCEIQQEMKTVKSCSIFVNTLDAQSPWNVMTVIQFPSAAASDPDQTRYDEFMAKWRAKLAEDKRENIVQGYDEFRQFVNEAKVRRVEFLK